MTISKKSVPLLILIGLSIISVGFIIFSIKGNRETVEKEKQTISISPGSTTEEQIIKGLGVPIASEGGVLQYKSNSPARNDEIKLNNGVVSFYKEIITYGDETNYIDLKTKYGDYEHLLYGVDAINGYYLYCYPEKGMAFLANPISSAVLEIWHFPTTNYKDFKTKWASEYSESFQGEK